MANLTIEENVIAYMKAATSESDWNERCDMVKGQNEGEYPSFLFQAIVLGGVLNEARQAW